MELAPRTCHAVRTRGIERIRAEITVAERVVLPCCATCRGAGSYCVRIDQDLHHVAVGVRPGKLLGQPNRRGPDVLLRRADLGMPEPALELFQRHALAGV